MNVSNVKMWRKFKLWNNLKMQETFITNGKNNDKMLKVMERQWKYWHDNNYVKRTVVNDPIIRLIVPLILLSSLPFLFQMPLVIILFGMNIPYSQFTTLFVRPLHYNFRFSCHFFIVNYVVHVIFLPFHGSFNHPQCHLTYFLLKLTCYDFQHQFRFCITLLYYHTRIVS
jgi:hypothetical protein